MIVLGIPNQVHQLLPLLLLPGCDEKVSVAAADGQLGVVVAAVGQVVIVVVAAVGQVSVVVDAAEDKAGAVVADDAGKFALSLLVVQQPDTA